MQSELDLTERLRLCTSRLSGEVVRTIAGKDFTRTETAVLFRVVRNSEVRFAELAERERLDTEELLAIVKRLVDAHLVSRRSDSQNESVTYIEPTTEGKQLIARIARERLLAIAPFVEALDEQERDALNAALPILERLTKHLQDLK